MNNTQMPLNSGFNAASTVADVMSGVSLSGKTAIVTGGHSGLGFETVKAFAAAGARVIVPARNPAQAAEALKSVQGVEIARMDLASQNSVYHFAKAFIENNEKLHILVNNAGIMATPTLEHDERGFEIQFATNHLGHFQLTGLLWPALVRAHGARVITLSSRAHRLSSVRFDDISFAQRPYDCWAAYGQSKTANILFSRELAKRGESWMVKSFSVHPGAIYGTRLMRNMKPAELQSRGALDAEGKAIPDLSLDRKSPEQGAATQVWCAVSDLLASFSGQYCEDVNISPLLSSDTPPMILGETASMIRAGVDAFTMNEEDAKRLWLLSEKVTGVQFA